MTVFIFLGSLLGAMALGIPIAYSLLVSGVALMWQLNLFDPQILAQNVINGADSFPLLAVPFFMLAGEIMNVGGLSKRIVQLAMTLVGHVRGGLGYVTILAACLMAALSGSAVADTAALAALLLPMMVRAGHRKDQAGGLIASAGIIAPVIPPSIGFVIFGVAANVSISKLFLAGIVPGLLMGVGIAVAWWFVARREGIIPPPKASNTHFSENSGFATSTGTNWNSAPHMATLSQPIQTTCTSTRVSGAARSAAGKPTPATMSASATNSHATAIAK